VGDLLIIDGQEFDPTNVNRMYGSRSTDGGFPKVDLIKRLATDIGLNTKVTTLQKHIYYKSSFAQLRNCDIVFGCTDDELGRSLLTKLPVYYYIPVFDMGVKIDHREDGTIRSINGRVTTLIPSAACLFCRGRINPTIISAEALSVYNPDEYAKRKAEGYVLGLNDTAPAVIPLTAEVASSAVLELLHRLTGCLAGC